MTGFRDVAIAIKPTNGGNYAIIAVMGPDSNSFGGLSPVNPAATLQGTPGSQTDLEDLFSDSGQSLTADVWNIYMIIRERLANQKLLQFKIVNNSGGISTIETAFLRFV